MMLRMLTRTIPRVPAVCIRQSTANVSKLSLAAVHQHAGIVERRASKCATFATQSSMSTSALADALQTELDYEKDVNEGQTEIPSPPGAWKLEDQPGTSLVLLTKRHKGEEITVELSVTNQEPRESEAQEAEEGEDAEEAVIDIGIQFSATVKKGKRQLSFDLESDGSYLQVIDVALLDDSDEADDEPYEGPKYDELDDKLHAAFIDYLNERDITEKLGDYLLQVADNKEQKEYVTWLQKVQRFVES